MKKFLSVLICCIMCIFAVSKPDAAAATVSSKAGKVSTSSTALNVRNAESTSSAVISSLSKGSYVTVIETSGDWLKIEYASGQYGYCSAKYITEVDCEPAVVNITSGYLNVRSGEGTSYASIARLNKNTAVLILSSNDGWCKILFNGVQTGYAYGAYLKKQTSASSSGEVKLNVPNYKQTDSRWASVTLGSSGKTIGSIGCTTTCLAMTESFRTGTTIYPDAMSKKLSYSSGGSLYWPSNYVTDTYITFAKIKTQLNNGKPVIIGLKTSSGSTHWVVITGCSGGKFYVNDPGSSSITLLSEVLQKYPQFYKIAYYN